MVDFKAKISFPSPTNDEPEKLNQPQAHPEQDSADASAEQLLFVPIHLLERNPSQPRSIADEEKLEELISTILLDGLIQPIAVLPKGDGSYQIVAGHRRVVAFQRLYERARGTDEQRRYQAIPAMVRPPLDDLKMATNVFIENDKRENLNLVDEAAALARIRDLLSAKLGREATAKEVGEAVGQKDEQRVSRLFRFHEAPAVVKEGVIGQRLVAKTQSDNGALLDVVKPTTKVQKTIDLHAALEFSRLHKYFAANGPARADEKTKKIIDRAREQGWSLRRIQAYARAILQGPGKRKASESPPFKFSDEQLVVYVKRIPLVPAEVRAQLRVQLQLLLRKLDRLDGQGTETENPGGVSAD